MNMSLTQMFAESGWVARLVIIFLLILSVYSIAVMIEKFMTYRAAKKQSIDFLPVLVKCLKENNLQGAVDKSKEFGKSHIARVVSAGLLEFLNQDFAAAASFDIVGAVTRALERETAITSAEMKKGLGGLATIALKADVSGGIGMTGTFTMRFGASSASSMPSRRPLAFPPTTRPAAAFSSTTSLRDQPRRA